MGLRSNRLDVWLYISNLDIWGVEAGDQELKAVIGYVAN